MLIFLFPLCEQKPQTMGFTMEEYDEDHGASKGPERIYHEQLLAIRRCRTDVELLPSSTEGTFGFSLAKELTELLANSSMCQSLG